MPRSFQIAAAVAGLGLLVTTAPLEAQTRVRITVTNLAPSFGTALTPVWLGVHDGSFAVFTPGAAASAGLERLAEDGNTAPLSDEFAAAGFSTQSVAFGPGGPLLPGQSASHVFTLDATNDMQRYLSYASMVIPSNDAFIGSGTMARDLTDGSGNYRNFSFSVLGSQVWDAGTEVNDEIPSNTAFLGQSVPNTGVDENGVVGLHQGFQPGGSILSNAQFANADFLAAGYQVARFDIQVVPEPAAWLLLASGLLFLGLVSARRRLA